MVRFQADVDFRSATNPSLSSSSNLEVLALAATETRVLVTHDDS